MVAVKGLATANCEPQNRPSHVGAVGGPRKDRRSKSPITIDVTLEKFERLCLTTGGWGMSRLRGSARESKPNSPSILMRRRNRAGMHTLQSIDSPIAVSECLEVDPSAPHAPRSSKEWAAFPTSCTPITVSSAVSYCSISERSTENFDVGMNSCESAEAALFLETSPVQVFV